MIVPLTAADLDRMADLVEAYGDVHATNRYTAIHSRRLSGAKDCQAPVGRVGRYWLGQIVDFFLHAPGLMQVAGGRI